MHPNLRLWSVTPNASSPGKSRHDEAGSKQKLKDFVGFWQRGNMFPKLESNRLILREIVHTDIQDIYNCFSNQEVTRYYGQDPFTKIEEAEQLVELFAKNYEEKRGIRWGIELKEQRRLIGTIGFHNWAPKHRRAEFGYELHPNNWGRGYATEAASMVISYGLNDLELTRIGAIVFLGNQASNDLLTKLGFVKEGMLRGYMYQNGVPHDTNIYSLIKSDIDEDA